MNRVGPKESVLSTAIPRRECFIHVPVPLKGKLVVTVPAAAECDTYAGRLHPWQSRLSPDVTRMRTGRTRGSHVSCRIRPSGAGPVLVVVKITHRLGIEPDMLHHLYSIEPKQSIGINSTIFIINKNININKY